MSKTMPVIGKLLGHKSPTTAQRYTRFDDAYVLAIAERIGSAIENLMDTQAGGRKATCQVISFSSPVVGEVPAISRPPGLSG